MNKIGLVVVLVLVIAGGLGGYIYFKNNRTLPGFDLQDKNSPKDLLKLTEASLSAEQSQTLLEEVKKQAKSSEKLTVKDCLGDPSIWQVSFGEKLKIENSDSVDHDLILTDKIRFKLPAGKLTEFESSLSAQTVYKYQCGDKQPGMIYVSEGISAPISREEAINQIDSKAPVVTTISLNDCSFKELSYKISAGTALRVSNTSSKSVIVGILNGEETTVTNGSTVTLKTSSLKPARYLLYCSLDNNIKQADLLIQ